MRRHPIRKYRDARDVSQSELARAAGFSVPLLSRIEHWQRVCTPERAKAISQATDGEIPIAVLLYPEDYPNWEPEEVDA